ncbi:hypothetical protein BABA_18277 [Neobacillus bataviensis LMG 21833]|uniref:Uncharacterized protein n=1 Tax=Neobacillus bataviensis LMG 21833 TaxID=1117379 RepID=K6DCS0_9BACI|nr:hypothetical protein [Neobacillus bataviensis]EKN65868.1 hypothetical protein BABA_18277 [Neobacillus bataviensis LMG 21833]
MQTIIWAIGSMVVLMLIISFLPLGYTLKGKFFVVLTSFVLSLGGLAAASTFPLWQTALMLFGLIFFTSYFMNNRLGTFLIKENPIIEEVYDKVVDDQQEEKTKEDGLMQIDEESTLLNSSFPILEKDSVSELSASQLSDIEEITDSESKTIDDEESFLLERNIELAVNEYTEDTEVENGYLSDIESLIEFESEIVQDRRDENDDLSLIILEKKKKTEQNGDVEEPLDDSLFDFLLAKKEVAAGNNVNKDKMEIKEKVSLQK